MEIFIRAVRSVSRLSGYVAAALIAIGVVVVCDMVFERYVLNRNTIWQTDFVTYCLVAATFIGSAYVLSTRGHVNVDVLPHFAGPRFRRALAIFASLVTLSFAVVLMVLTFLFWKEAWDNRWVSDTMWRARLWIPYSSMPIGLALLTLECVAGFLELLTRRTEPFGLDPKEAN